MQINVIEYFEKGAKFPLMKTREGYFRKSDHQMMHEMYTVRALPAARQIDRSFSWRAWVIGALAGAMRQLLENPPLARRLGEYPETVAAAARELAPSWRTASGSPAMTAPTKPTPRTRRSIPPRGTSDRPSVVPCREIDSTPPPRTSSPRPPGGFGAEVAAASFPARRTARDRRTFQAGTHSADVPHAHPRGNGLYGR